MERVDASRIDRVKKKRSRKWIFRVLIIICIGVMGVGGYFASQIWGAFAQGHDSNSKISGLRDEEVKIKEEPFTIMLLGVDQLSTEEEKESWRPDVIMIAAINPKTNSMKLVSIPRDTLVHIANTKGKDKINSAASYGRLKNVDGVENTRQTVEEFLNIPIDYYAKINFQGFIDVVDALGGVDVNNKFYFSTQSHTGDPLRYSPGPLHLDGEKALAYVRMRKKDINGDMGRNERQRDVVNKLIDQMISFEGFTKFNDVATAVGENLSYSFKPTDIPSLQKTYSNIPKQNTESIELKTYSDKQNGIFYEICSQEERIRVSDLLQKHLEYTPKEPMKLNDY
ncbi:LCP family protein [Hazenella coriacea]|uniref:LytR family transcriptional attenuator n=1 Tax=Hazenella coriacea TaxID=1179467 RepID=A0A4R3L7I7_9BACL|nr:LCP family protein [Hazenella coriacea]TCS95639.1 LytR family transcriptional attenuator [Hazenella coriacea]